MFLKNYLWILLIFLSNNILMAQDKFSNYKKYPKTNQKFKLVEVTENLNYPWGMTFIDKENLLVTEKNGKLYKIGHHKSHAANAFFSSNFNQSLIVTIDGGGNESENTSTCATIYEGKNNQIKKVNVFNAGELNLASGWNLVTKLFDLSIGFPKGNQAGTVMAMASPAL